MSKSNASPLISVAGLKKTYRQGFWLKKKEALRGISFELKAGEILGYLGPNGAGKTTTFKILTGLLRADAGDIRLFGRPHQDIRIREKIGFLPEEPYFYEYLSVAEYLLFCGRLFNIDRNRLKARTAEVVDILGLKQHSNTRTHKLSKGLRQRLGLAQCLINEPELLILDEPLGGLDPLGRKYIKDTLSALRNKGKSILISSHIIADMESLCDRIALIKEGRITRMGSLYELLKGEVKYYEVVLKGASSTLKSRLENAPEATHISGKTITLNIRQEKDLSRFIDLARDNNAFIYSITPVQQSLEDLLISDISAAAEGPDNKEKVS